MTGSLPFWRWFSSFTLLMSCFFSLMALGGSFTPTDFSARIELSQSKIGLCDPLEVKLTLSHPKGYRVDINTLTANLLYNPTPEPAPFLLKSRSEEIGEQETVVNFLLEPQIPGTFALTFYDMAFLSVQIQDKEQEDNRVTLISDIVSVTVEMAPIVDLNAELLPEAAVPLTFSTRLPIEISPQNKKASKALSEKDSKQTASLLEKRSLPWQKMVSLLVGIAFIFVIRNIASRPTVNLEKQEKQAREKALQTLEELRLRDLTAKDDFDTFYTRLVDTVRFYIEDRYRIKASRQTTQEFFTALSKEDRKTDLPKDSLHRFLNYSDQIKFAKSQASYHECEEAFQAARDLILEK